MKIHDRIAIAYLLLSSILFLPDSSAAEIDLLGLSPEIGFVLEGIDLGDSFGVKGDGRGDFNGDGLTDLVLAAYRGDGIDNSKPDAGEVYVIFGDTADTISNIDLTNLEEDSRGVTIYGADEGDRFGVLSDIGDIDGDGFSDLLIGAPFGDSAQNSRPDAGEVYVIYGTNQPPQNLSLDLDDNPMRVSRFWGSSPGDECGIYASVAGDVNGDGHLELLIGAYLADGPDERRPDAGEVYLIWGKAGGFEEQIDLSRLSASQGLVIYGRDSVDLLGASCAGLGDITGDGLSDIILGAAFGDGPLNQRAGAGEAFVIFGDGLQDYDEIDLRNSGNGLGLTIYGESINDSLGFQTERCRDINGDGLSDMIIGIPVDNGPTSETRRVAGALYVMLGSTSYERDVYDFSLGHFPPGYKIDGADAFDNTNNAYEAGDINGDGYADILVGVLLADGPDNLRPDGGEARLLYGRPTSENIDLKNPTNTELLTIYGESSMDYLGVTIAPAGDVNNDGLQDILLGATQDIEFGEPIMKSGKCYVVFGSQLAAEATYSGYAIPGESPLFSPGGFGSDLSLNSPSNCWIDFDAGSGPSGGASLQTVTSSRSEISLNFKRSEEKLANTSSLAPEYWVITTDRTEWDSANLVFRYRNNITDLLGVDESSLTLYHTDDLTSPWKRLSTTVDIDRNLVFATTTAMGYFAISADNRSARILHGTILE